MSKETSVENRLEMPRIRKTHIFREAFGIAGRFRNFLEFAVRGIVPTFIVHVFRVINECVSIFYDWKKGINLLKSLVNIVCGGLKWVKFQ